MRTTLPLKILTLQEYCSDVISFKTYSKPYNMRLWIEKTEENQAVFRNVPEPIIDRAAWKEVQNLQLPGADVLPSRRSPAPFEAI